MVAEGIGSLSIRAAVEADLAALQLLYRHLHPQDPELSPAQAQAGWHRLLAHPGTTVFLGTLPSGLAVTSCTLHVMPNLTRNAAPYGVIENVVTHEQHRQRGYGKSVLARALAESWRQGCYKVMLMTGSKRESTLRFYEAAGFHREKTAFVARPPGSAG